ncbi:MAG: YoaK family protein [Pseudomonadota bacterium]
MTHVVRSHSVPAAVPALLGVIAGFVDICAFLGLFHIFVAQLTGSFVYAGAHLLSGDHEWLALLAIPAFFLAGCLATALAFNRAPGGRALAWVMALECVLLAAMMAAMMTMPLGSITAPGVAAAALLGISAMGVQSAMVRLFMHGVPSTNVMTTNTTQLAIDATIALIALARRHQTDAEAGQARGARARLALQWPPMAGFVAGTAIGAVGYELVGARALAAPLAVACVLLIWSMRRERQPAPA